MNEQKSGTISTFAGNESSSTITADVDYSMRNNNDDLEISIHHSLLIPSDNRNEVGEDNEIDDDEELGPATVRMCQEALEDPAIVALTEGKDLDTLAPFHFDELHIGDFLGRGEFCNVYEIKAFSDNPRSAHQRTKILNETRGFLAKNAIRNTGQYRYAIKYLRKELTRLNEKKFKNAARDLAVEAKFLHSIEHPHIIKIRGHATAGAAGFDGGRHDGFFLILDRLGETLSERIYTTWKKENRKIKCSLLGKLRSSMSINSSNSSRSSNDSNSRWSIKTSKEFMAERIKVAYDISGAVYHLHRRNIVYRDLKPTNLGFDIRGDIKLFDFGLAKQLPNDQDMNEDIFKMSAAGSMRYMAPEVLLHEPYNLKADVYSFSILLWEILSLQKPFPKTKVHDFVDKICHQNDRPKINKKEWPSSIQDVIDMSWDRDLSERPSMMVVQNILRYQLQKMSDSNDESGLDHGRRRSMGSIGTVAKSGVFTRSDSCPN